MVDDCVLADAGTYLPDELDWHGFAMVEFKYDPYDGRSKYIEIDLRFWGSLPLAVLIAIKLNLYR